MPQVTSAPDFTLKHPNLWFLPVLSELSPHFNSVAIGRAFGQLFSYFKLTVLRANEQPGDYFLCSHTQCQCQYI